MYKNIILGLGLLFANYTYGSSSEAEQTFMERHSTAILGVSAVVGGLAAFVFFNRRNAEKALAEKAHAELTNEYNDLANRFNNLQDRWEKRLNFIITRAIDRCTNDNKAAINAHYWNLLSSGYNPKSASSIAHNTVWSKCNIGLFGK